MTHSDLADNEDLLARLSLALEEADPVPDEAVATAVALAELTNADAELATLVADSLLDDEVVLFRHDVTMQQQGELADRMVSFSAPELSVDVDLHANGASMVGAISPAMAVDVDLETAGGIVTTRSDDLGRFHFDAPSGLCRLVVHGPGAPVVTPWITR